MVEQQDPERYRELLAMAERQTRDRFALYQEIARLGAGAGPTLKS